MFMSRSLVGRPISLIKAVRASMPFWARVSSSPSLGSISKTFSAKRANFFGPILYDMTVVDGMQYGKTSAVVAEGIGAQAVFQDVALEVRLLSQFEDPVFRHSRKPYKVAAGSFVVRIHKDGPDIIDSASHKGFVHDVRHVIVIGFTEVDFQSYGRGCQKHRR